MLLDQVVSFDGFAMAVNYGLDKLRFPAPLFVGDSVRLRVQMTGIEEFPGGATLALKLTFESSRGGKPVCVADVCTACSRTRGDGLGTGKEIHP